MKKFAYLLAFAFVALSAIADEDEKTEEEDSDVVVLTTANFNDVVGSNDRVLVEFYAPWCGHCKALAPEYEKAATKLKESGSQTILAKVDATEEKDLATKYGVRGYPTLKFFTKDLDNPQDYSGGRTEATLISWITKREQPAVSELADLDAVEAFKQKNNICVVAYLSDEAQIAVIREAAETMREYAAVALVSDNAAQEACSADDGSVVLYRQFDEPSIKFEGELNAEALLEFVNAERFALFDQISTSNYKDYVDRGLPLVWVALDPSEEAVVESINNAIKSSALANKGVLSFVWIDNSKYGQHVGNLGITNVPGMILIKDNDKFLFDGDVTSEESVTAFFTKYSAGELEKFLKSQEIPEENDEPVFVLVGKNFDEVVGQEKDVLVEFYAPWCGHCKKLAPEYEKIGVAFQAVDDLVIAKIDATENDTPEDIRGFPTLIFYPKGSSKGTKYTGGRTAAEIIPWLEEQATVDVSSINKEEL